MRGVATELEVRGSLLEVCESGDKRGYLRDLCGIIIADDFVNPAKVVYLAERA